MERKQTELSLITELHFLTECVGAIHGPLFKGRVWAAVLVSFRQNTLTRAEKQELAPHVAKIWYSIAWTLT